MGQITMTQEILKTIGKTLSSVVEKYFYLTRPNSISEDMRSFAVISLPVKFRRKLYGYSTGRLESSGIIYVFSKAKANNTPNIADLTSTVESVERLFPIKGDAFSCIDPEIQYMGSDDYGYQISRISFNILVKTY